MSCWRNQSESAAGDVRKDTPPTRRETELRFSVRTRGPSIRFGDKERGLRGPVKRRFFLTLDVRVRSVEKVSKDQNGHTTKREMR